MKKKSRCFYINKPYVAICAERAAIAGAVSKGEYLIEAIAVIAKSDHFDVKKIAGPCGVCR